MNERTAIYRNKLAARKFRDAGWSPALVGASPDDPPSVIYEKIRAFQRLWPDLVEDGWMGAKTFWRAVVHQANVVADAALAAVPDWTVDAIVVGGERVRIPWPHVRDFREDPSLLLKAASTKPGREVNLAVVHWTNTISHSVAIDVLKRRRLSTHFLIAPPVGPKREAVIYQCLDVMWRGSHASGANVNTVGVDIVTPVTPMALYEEKGKELGFPPYSVIKRPPKVNGWQPPPIYDYFPEQIDALMALMVGLADCGVVPLSTPTTDHSLNLQRIPIEPRFLTGWVHHAEVGTKAQGKWDTVGIHLPALVNRAKALRERRGEGGVA